MAVIRIGSSKVKTGCSTCKSRHLKCDETRPVCLRCTRSGFKCGFESPEKPKPPARFVHYTPEVHSSISPRTKKSTDELRGLEYFHLQTALNVAYPFSPDVWTNYLLLLAGHEPSIGYALAAFGLAHRHFDHGGVALPDAALRLYNESIKLVVQQWRDESSAAPEVALASSMIFACLELLRGCFRSAISIVASANRLLNEVDKGAKSWNEAKFPKYKVRVYLIQLSIQVIDVGGFVDDQEDYHRHSVIMRPGSMQYSTCDDAMMGLAVIYNQVIHFHDCVEKIGPRADLHPHWENMTEQMYLLREEYRRWLAAFGSLKEDNPPGRRTSATMTAIGILELLSHIVSIMVDLDLLSPEDDFDRHVHAFRAIVDSAELALRNSSGSARPVFSLTTAYVGPLYFVAARCRNSEVRHRALRLLKSCGRREGMWDSAVVASIAEKIVKLEEGSARRQRTSSRAMDWQDDMGEEGDCSEVQDRVKLVTIDWNEEVGGKAKFSKEYAGSVRSGDRLGGLEFRELVSW